MLRRTMNTAKTGLSSDGHRSEDQWRRLAVKGRNHTHISECLNHLSMSVAVHSFPSFLLFFICNVDEVQHRVDIGFQRRKMKLTR